MKISVVIIAHNEERYIERCIRSVFMQTRRPDEVIVIAHNCTDRTEILARQFAVTIISYDGPVGTAYSRIEGLKHATGDYILMIDGDAYAAANWVQVMCEALENDNTVLVGSWIRFVGTAILFVSNFWNYFFCSISRYPERWVWGASMAFKATDKVYIQETLRKSIERSKELHLTRNPEDFWLGLAMRKKGTIFVTNKTWVATNVHEETSIAALKRNRENLRNGNRMERFMKYRSEL